MIFVTGDVHGDPISRLSGRNFPESRLLTEEDYVIVLGDFGVIWAQEQNKEEKYILNWLDSKPWTTLFVDGNHENFERLNAFPVDEWHGGKVHRISNKVLHLMRGQVFDIEGLTFLAFGGAPSHDIRDGILEPDDPLFKEKYHYLSRSRALFRVNHISWWKEEEPNSEEYVEAWKNLEAHNNKVDYVLTHECPASATPMVSIFPPTTMSKRLEELRSMIEYDYWLFGHYHLDSRINLKDECYYEGIRRIN